MSPVTAENEYLIHYYEIDYKKRCLITSIINYFQDMAILQSEELGLGIDYLKENNIFWVLYKWDINIKRYPVFDETVKVRTWPSSFLKFHAYRQFEMYDRHGEIIATGNTMWLLLNGGTKRPVKVPEEICKRYGVDQSSGKAQEFEDIEKMEAVDDEKLFQVRYSDIDTNLHVNNVKYVDWALETVPLDIVRDWSLERLMVTYKKEAEYGKNIKSLSQIQNNGDSIVCLHRIEDMEGKELTLLKSIWKK